MSFNDKFRFVISVGGKHRGLVTRKTVTAAQICEKLSKPLEDHSVR